MSKKDTEDLSLIPFRWKEEEDPQDKGGKSPHPSFPPVLPPLVRCYPLSTGQHVTPTPFQPRAALAVATAGVEPLVTARQTWSVVRGPGPTQLRCRGFYRRVAGMLPSFADNTYGFLS